MNCKYCGNKLNDASRGMYKYCCSSQCNSQYWKIIDQIEFTKRDEKRKRQYRQLTAKEIKAFGKMRNKLTK